MFSHQDDVSIAKAIVFKAHPFCSAIFRLSLFMRALASTRAILTIVALMYKQFLIRIKQKTLNQNFKEGIIESFTVIYRKHNFGNIVKVNKVIINPIKP